MNIYCFSTLSFAKLQFKSVINKAFHKHGVASFTDAWIETDEDMIVQFDEKSHLLQMRGLKQKKPELKLWRMGRIFYRCVDWNKMQKRKEPQWSVASFTDAWIETRITYQSTPGCWSHLLQMRGLKLRRNIRIWWKWLSHLLQMRGLKPN